MSEGEDAAGGCWAGDLVRPHGTGVSSAGGAGEQAAPPEVASGNEAAFVPHSGWETCSSLNRTDQIVVEGGPGAGTRGSWD